MSRARVVPALPIHWKPPSWARWGDAVKIATATAYRRREQRRWLRHQRSRTRMLLAAFRALSDPYIEGLGAGVRP